MKAKVKDTGEIVEVRESGIMAFPWCDTSGNHLWKTNELEFIYKDTTDYWEKLKHQYAGMAMQGLISNSAFFKDIDRVTNGKPQDLTVSIAEQFATALVEKLKEESNGN